MSINENVQDAVWIMEEKQGWPPAARLILAFIIGFILLSPAILGLYWEALLP